jgi:hypothetical protein
MGQELLIEIGIVWEYVGHIIHSKLPCVVTSLQLALKV